MISVNRLSIILFTTALLFVIGFLYLQPLVENITRVTPAMTTSSITDQDFTTLSNEFNVLRQQRGHWDGGSYSKEVDGSQGKKVQVMKALGDILGLPGTPAVEILQAMGKPDELTPKLNDVERIEVEMMPGPIIGSDDSPAPASNAGSASSYYLVYYWRGKHDYLYFKIDAVTEKVITSGWYNALD